jgi:hypothetical protein
MILPIFAGVRGHSHSAPRRTYSTLREEASKPNDEQQPYRRIDIINEPPFIEGVFQSNACEMQTLLSPAEKGTSDRINLSLCLVHKKRLDKGRGEGERGENESRDLCSQEFQLEPA